MTMQAAAEWWDERWAPPPEATDWDGHRRPTAPVTAGDWLGALLAAGAVGVATAPDRLVVLRGRRALGVRLHADGYRLTGESSQTVGVQNLGLPPALTAHARKRVSTRWAVPPNRAAGFLAAALAGAPRQRHPRFGSSVYAVTAPCVAVFARCWTGWECVTAYPPCLIDGTTWPGVLAAMRRGRFQWLPVNL